MRTPLSAVALACMAGALGLTATAVAAPAPTVTVRGTVNKVPSYQKSFHVTSCKAVGTKGVTLSGEDGVEVTLSVNANRVPGSLLILGGGGDEAFDLRVRGKVTAVSITGPKASRKVTVKGAFAPSSKVPGVFTITGDCP